MYVLVFGHVVERTFLSQKEILQTALEINENELEKIPNPNPRHFEFDSIRRTNGITAEHSEKEINVKWLGKLTKAEKNARCVEAKGVRV